MGGCSEFVSVGVVLGGGWVGVGGWGSSMVDDVVGEWWSRVGGEWE